jgi:hypothetical protein
MKYLFRPFYAIGLGLFAYVLSVFVLLRIWVLFPLWHLKWPTESDFGEDWVSRKMFFEEWPRELWLRLTGRFQGPE